MWIAGFDPGGKGNFGWCVVEASDRLPLFLRRSGIESNAADAVGRVLQAVPRSESLIAAGIDSPLFWSATGDRNADRVIRKQIAELGATASSGTVQHVNSLKGACLVQGVLAAYLLRQALPSIRITESHPKALLWLVHVAAATRPVSSISMRALGNLIRCDAEGLSEHERDAALGAVGAWAMIVKPAGWRDLSRDESHPFMPVPPVEYWMPQNAAEPRLAADAPQAARR